MTSEEGPLSMPRTARLRQASRPHDYRTCSGTEIQAAPPRLSWTTPQSVPSVGSLGAKYFTSLSETRPSRVSKRSLESLSSFPTSEYQSTQICSRSSPSRVTSEGFDLPARVRHADAELVLLAVLLLLLGAALDGDALRREDVLALERERLDHRVRVDAVRVGVDARDADDVVARRELHAVLVGAEDRHLLRAAREVARGELDATRAEDVEDDREAVRVGALALLHGVVRDAEREGRPLGQERPEVERPSGCSRRDCSPRRRRRRPRRRQRRRRRAARRERDACCPPALPPSPGGAKHR